MIRVALADVGTVGAILHVDHKRVRGDSSQSLSLEEGDVGERWGHLPNHF